MYYVVHALVAQWIEHLASDQGIAGSNPAERTNRIRDNISRYGLVVECVLAKDETRVRFSLPAPI